MHGAKSVLTCTRSSYRVGWLTFAHHGLSAYDEKNPVTLKGTVTNSSGPTHTPKLFRRERRKRKRHALGLRDPQSRKASQGRLVQAFTESRRPNYDKPNRRQERRARWIPPQARTRRWYRIA